MARRLRVDAEVVRRGLARSRTQAADMIAAGRISVDGQVIGKPATQVDPAQALVVAPDAGGGDYVSRGAYKLIGALDALTEQLDVGGRICLDAGASTGGFTDVLLRRGARLVWAVDVGYGQLAWRLREDERVKVRERTNVRYMVSGELDPAPDLVVGDLSFISLTTVLPALMAVASPRSDFVLMVKPQFEVGRRALPKGGVVRDLAQRARAVRRVADFAQASGLAVRKVVRSPLPGPNGNVEFFLHVDYSAEGLTATQLEAAINEQVGSQPAGRVLAAERADVPARPSAGMVIA